MIEPRLERFLTLELGTRAVRHSDRDLYTHLAGTHDLLEAWGNPPEICNAGLFHSIYGTAVFRHCAVPLARRNIVQDLIGIEAERLAYIFCVTRRPAAFLNLVGTNQRIVYDCHTNRLLALERRQFESLLEIETANLVEQGGRIAPALRILVAGGITMNAQHYVERALTEGGAT